METTYKLIDTHAHLDYEGLGDNLDGILGNALDAGVEKIIVPGVELAGIPRIIEIIEKYDNVFGAVAVHPSDAKDWQDGDYETLKKYAQHEKIVAIGETGLDYYHDKTFIDTQKQAFRAHLQLARELNLPVMIHDREAHADTMAILKEYPDVKGVMHCFSGSVEFAMECIKIGYYIALGGPVTFKNAHKPKEVAAKMPIDRLLLETDAPFLAPHPYRGQQNEPANIKFIAEEIANLRGISLEELANATSVNAEKLFRI
jgi:TatD DNase family protein